MKAYKYYVHGKPKTFDLTTLTDDEIEKFKNMDNTERLRFIELHHLENKPLWDTVDIKTSTKLTDEGLTNEKNYKKYYDLYKNQNIKNKLEQMKENGKTGEVNEKDLKEVFSDEDYKDINDKVKKGYKDYDSLINYYANKQAVADSRAAARLHVGEGPSVCSPRRLLCDFGHGRHLRAEPYHPAGRVLLRLPGRFRYDSRHRSVRHPRFKRLLRRGPFAQRNRGLPD